MKYFDSDELKHFSQQTADAISAVMHMQVTVVDQDVKKVAGTGCFAENVLKVLPTNYVFTRVISSGEVCLIENPGKSIYCASCVEREECKEKATLMVPVLLEGQVIGGIGLAAMTEEDKETLLTKSESFTNFMKKMADLLAAKVKSELAIRDTLLLTKNLEAVTDTFTDGILSIDGECKITHFNRHAELLLGLEQSRVIGKDYRDILYCHLIDNALKTPMNAENLKIAIVVGGTERPMLASVRSILHEGKIRGVVVFFQEISSTKKKYEQVLMSNTRYTFESILGNSREISYCIDMAKRISVSNSSVLILGESGTGKELFARAIHNASHRRHNNFVAINCSAIPDTLLESELFGYAGGAFTGAKKEGHMGKFEAADGGTIFLDEIGDMPLNLQAKILRVLQERTVERVGSSVSTPIDVRVIAATNRDLEQMIHENHFRQDLYYRINVIPIKIPPLRQRRGDVELISKALLNKYALLLGKNVTGIQPEVMRLLVEWQWPGNIRELENVIEYAMNMELSRNITVDSLPPYLLESDGVRSAAEHQQGTSAGDLSLSPSDVLSAETPEGDQEPSPEVWLGMGDSGTRFSGAGFSGAGEPSAADNEFAPEGLPQAEASAQDGGAQKNALREMYLESERAQIVEALAQFENSTEGKKQCAKSLHISLSTLYRRMKELGIERR